MEHTTLPRKPKLLIIGHARHGKDTFGALVVAKMGLSFVSSSEFVGRAAIWEQWGKERYCSFSEFFEDRSNYRSIWYNFITAYNTPNLARTGEEMMAIHDVYVGMRNPDEFKACIDKDLFDYVIWVDGSKRHPPEGKDSNGMTKEMADIWIDNNGPEELLSTAVSNLQERLHQEGFAVEYVPEPKSKLEFDLDTPTMTDESDLLAVQEIEERMIVNPTLEESRRFHNDALMATCQQSRKLDSVETLDPRFTAVEDNSLCVGEDIPQTDADWHKAAKDLEWTDMPTDSTKVLDHGFFKVIGVMGTDQAIVDAARMSYGRGTKPTNSSAGLINYLVRNYHTSPLEMCEIKFHIRMPIFVMRQWVRHRTANLNEYSGRYSEMIRLFYVPEPEQICHQSTINKQGSAEPMSSDNARFIQHEIADVSDNAFDMYERLLASGLSRETARIILPLNTYTEVVWKLDISNLLKFLRLRDDDHAQWEIRQYAKLVSRAVATHFPLVFAAYTESRASQSFSEAEIAGLVTGDCSHISHSQAGRIHTLREDAELFVS